MAQRKFQLHIETLTAILNVPDTELKDIILEGFKLLKFDPEILVRIAEDIELAAKHKKSGRLEDQAFYEQLNGIIPGLELYLPEGNLASANLYLYQGRPRLLDPEAIFLLMMCRAHLDSVTPMLLQTQLVIISINRKYK